MRVFTKRLLPNRRYNTYGNQFRNIKKRDGTIVRREFIDGEKIHSYCGRCQIEFIPINLTNKYCAICRGMGGKPDPMFCD